MRARGHLLPPRVEFLACLPQRVADITGGLGLRFLLPHCQRDFELGELRVTLIGLGGAAPQVRLLLGEPVAGASVAALRRSELQFPVIEFVFLIRYSLLSG